MSDMTARRVSVSEAQVRSALRRVASTGTIRVTANQERALNGRTVARSAGTGRLVSSNSSQRTPTSD